MIDWHRLAFDDYRQVDRFLRVNELDPDSKHSGARASTQTPAGPMRVVRDGMSIAMRCITRVRPPSSILALLKVDDVHVAPVLLQIVDD